MRKLGLRILYLLVSCFMLVGSIGYYTYGAQETSGKEELINKRLEYAYVLYVGNHMAFYNNLRAIIDPDNVSVKPVIKNGKVLLPVGFVIEANGGKISWNTTDSTIVITYGNRKIVTALNSKKIKYSNGSEYTLEEPIQSIYGKMYLPMEVLAEVTGLKAFWDPRGLVILSYKDNIFDPNTEADLITRIVDRFEYRQKNIIKAKRTYYVDNVNGDDTNDGTSPEKAWKSVSKVNGSGFSAGDAVLFKRGQVFRGMLVVSNSGSAGSPITYSAYGEGEAPVISGANVIKGWQSDPDRQAVYKLILTEGPSTGAQVLTSNGFWVTHAKAIDANQKAAHWYYDSASKTVYLKDVDGNPDDTGKTIEFGMRKHVIHSNAQKNITIDGLTLEKSNFPAIEIVKGSDNWIFRHNLVQLSHESGWGAGGLRVFSNGIKITDNIFRQLRGDDIWGSGKISNVYIANNFLGAVYDSTGDNIQFQEVSNFRIIKNWMSQKNTNTPKGCFICERSTNGYLADNLIEYGNFALALYGNDMVAERNICRYQNKATWAGSIFVAGPADCKNHLYRNNIVYESNFGIMVDQPKCKRENYRFYNNTIYNCIVNGVKSIAPLAGEFKNNIVWCPNASAQVVRITLGITGQQWVSDYNIIGPEKKNFYTYLQNSYSTMDEVKAGLKKENHSYSWDPVFKNAPLDFHLMMGSPAIDKGMYQGMRSDYENQPVPQGEAINIGALETIIKE